MVARERGKEKKIRTTPYLSLEKAKESMCWCTFSVTVTRGKKIPTIECIQCRKTFHTLCAGIAETDEQLEQTFICIECSNTPKIPTLFRDRLRGSGKFQGKGTFRN